MASTPHIISWKYNDWRRQATTAAQIERLKLHIEEVEGFVLEFDSKASKMKLSDGYLAGLETRLKEMEIKSRLASVGNRGGVSTFIRGSGP